MPIISVVVLTYNSERYIKRCLRSLERQSLGDFEVIVVDAGSTDGTRDIVAQFDPRFIWLELPKSDMGAARNHGMRNSHGRYIMFLDSDDFYLEDKLRLQVDELNANVAVDVTYCAAWHFRTAHPEQIGRKRNSLQPVKFKDFFAGRNHNLNTMCIRRSVWDAGFAFGEGSRGRYGEEWRLQLSMARQGVAMSYIAEPLVVSEMRPDSHTIWSRQWIMKQEAISELEHTATLLNDEQRSTIDVTAVIDEFRSKLVVALLLDTQKSEAGRIARMIQDRRLARKSMLLTQISRVLPGKLLASLLRSLWLWRQDRSFVWQATLAGIRDAMRLI